MRGHLADGLQDDPSSSGAAELESALNLTGAIIEHPLTVQAGKRHPQSQKSKNIMLNFMLR